MSPKLGRRRFLRRTATAATLIGVPVFAAAARALPPMTEGPFYPSPAYRALRLDWDADLTRVREPAPDGQPQGPAAGELLDLFGTLQDPSGRRIDRAEIEIWQCDAFGSYRHPRGAGRRVDAGFQGFGSARSDASGAFRFRTIRPVPYPGRTPHIHVKLRHPAFGELTSQLFVAGEPDNDRDGIFLALAAPDRRSVEMQLEPAPAGAGVAWITNQKLFAGSER